MKEFRPSNSSTGLKTESYRDGAGAGVGSGKQAAGLWWDPGRLLVPAPSGVTSTAQHGTEESTYIAE